MNYARVYADFIENRRAKEPSLVGYSEVHHILPRALGGGDEAENLIRLSAEDHFFAHLLLAKMHGGAMLAALNMMCVGRSGICRNYLGRMRRRVAIARELAGRHHSVVMKGMFAGEKHPMYGKPCSDLAKARTSERHAAGLGPMSSPDVRRKVSLALRGRVFSDEHKRKISESKTGQARSVESRRKQSESIKGRRLSPSTKEKLRLANTGRKRTPEQIEKMRAASLGRKLTQETKDKISAAWHERGHPRGMLGKSHSDAYKEMMVRFNAAKRAYAAQFGVPYRSITKAMLAESGMGVE